MRHKSLGYNDDNMKGRGERERERERERNFYICSLESVHLMKVCL